MTNPVLVLTHNCLELTKRCVDSILSQDIGDIHLLVFDNNSTDGTREWLPDSWPHGDPGPQFNAFPCRFNMGVSYGWNWGLSYFFGVMEAESVLVVNNDTILPKYLYRSLKPWTKKGFEFVSAATVRELPLPNNPVISMPYPSPDFSCFLLTKKIYESIGQFDERMKHYCSDCDWHIRAHQKNYMLWNSGVPFFHECSGTIHNSTPLQRKEIEDQAHSDREYFKDKWGCYPGTPQYAKLLS